MAEFTREHEAALRSLLMRAEGYHVARVRVDESAALRALFDSGLLERTASGRCRWKSILGERCTFYEGHPSGCSFRTDGNRWDGSEPTDANPELVEVPLKRTPIPDQHADLSRVASTLERIELLLDAVVTFDADDAEEMRQHVRKLREEATCG